ncbi:MAG: efflux RND transporter periplasmic adaptor subunit [Synergistaceae bacterium]|jgi:RND family efflux transporter MFP subunit|nr:efflux RND transporter periplasmic adaptor subunit [Synergistaceae bacterium]
MSRKSGKKKGYFIVLLILSVGILAALGVYTLGLKDSPASSQESAPEPPAAFVQIETATDNNVIRDSIVQNMSVEAIDRVQMTPRVTGRLERLHVKPGDIVKKGQLIATLEHEQQNAQISSTEAQIASSRADTERARAEMMNAKTNLERYERLLKEGFSTQQQYDSMATAYASARASHNAALAKERQAVSELGLVKSSQQDYIMRSPLDGTVLSDYSLTSGAMISPSSPIVDIADLRKLKATLRIPEIKIFVVKPGMNVMLKFDALPDEEFQGQVTRVEAYVDEATRTSAVEIELNNEAIGNRLRPGMFGQAFIVEREFRNAVQVLGNAIYNGESGPYVFVEDNGIAHLKNIKTGRLTQGNYTHVTEGIASGDRVIVFGGANLNDGDKVIVQ